MSDRKLMALAAGLAAWTSGVAAAAEPAQDYPIRPVPFTQAKFTDDFWTRRIATNREVTVWYDFEKCEETGRIANFKKAAGRMPGDFKGTPFDDSDVFKVVEGAAYSLALQPDPKLDKYLDELIDHMAAAQEPDGYLYTVRRIQPKERIHGMAGRERWSNLGISHELYNVGHMYEAAVAHYLATGKRSLLDVAVKNADLLVKTFGPGDDQLKHPPGHQEIEIGLVKLYRVTGEKKYLDLAQFFIDMRGRKDLRPNLYGEYSQDHVPLVQQDHAVGHSVRAAYWYSGIADVAAITGNQDYLKAIDRIWQDVAHYKLYITGGIGSSGGHEGFGERYALPNRSAYNETCAAIANILWNHRMFLLHGEAGYIDVLERTLYNGFLSGIAISGDRFFYPNPLAADAWRSAGPDQRRRSAWFGCSCCPVNIVRTIPSVSGYLYAVTDDRLYVNLYGASEAATKVGDVGVKLAQKTGYPWDGAVALTLQPAQAKEFALHLRIPGWARNQPVPGELYRYSDGLTPKWTVQVNGRAETPAVEKGYAVIRRTWKPGDVVNLSFEMPVRRVAAHPRVEANIDRVAFERGPVVYCFEGIDNSPDGDVRSLVVDPDAKFEAVMKPDLLNGVMVLKGPGRRADRSPEGKISARPVELTAVPYYAWAHRDMGGMAVWMATKPEAARLPPVPTPASQAKAAASFVGNGTLAAINDQQEPRKSNDSDCPYFTWWPHYGTKEWIELRFAAPTKVSGVEVYWFDDTGAGACKVPESWTLMYQDGETWKPVENASAYGVAKDQYNVTTFTPVTAGALRIEVKLREGASGGMQEWRVK